MRILINGVGYDTQDATFRVYATLPKSLKDWRPGCRTFHFTDGSYADLEVFVNRSGNTMLRVLGRYYGYSYDLHTYLIARRADVTKYINKLKTQF